VQVAAARDARPEDIVQPGHIFPLMAQSGGVLMRAGHTEAGCDLAQLAGLVPASVICEVLKEDGTMARLPDLIEFGREHGLKIGAIADLIAFRSENESLIRRVAERDIETAQGAFRLVVYLEKLSGAMHLALVRGNPASEDVSLVRVHEPLSIIDLLDAGHSTHSWSIPAALAHIAANGSGVLVMLNCEQGAVDLIERVASAAPRRPPVKMDLLSYGIGAQILRDLGVRRMNLMTQPRKIPSMTGWQLEVLDFIAPGQA
jgi:3,4-dihydroxy 2-butanone 4-phosphate synthase/GTP cyclohydrolase II